MVPTKKKKKTMLVQNLGEQTKSILVFSETADCKQREVFVDKSRGNRPL